jgi:SAM-dependent methyltransferase
MSETQRYRELTTPYCYTKDKRPGVVLDVASQGDPVVPWAWQLDLPPDKFAWYNSNHPPAGPIQLRGDGAHLPVDSNSLDCLYSSHLLEDYKDWMPVLKEWVRVIKPGGYLVVLIPDRGLWAAALARGQTPNCEHRHEGEAGELTSYAPHIGVKVIEDRLTNLFDGDYTILFVAQKI